MSCSCHWPTPKSYPSPPRSSQRTQCGWKKQNWRILLFATQRYSHTDTDIHTYKKTLIIPFVLLNFLKFLFLDHHWEWPRFLVINVPCLQWVKRLTEYCRYFILMIAIVHKESLIFEWCLLDQTKIWFQIAWKFQLKGTGHSVCIGELISNKILNTEIKGVRHVFFYILYYIVL